MRSLAFWAVMAVAVVGATKTLWTLIYLAGAIMLSLYLLSIYASLSGDRKKALAERLAIAKRADKQHRQFMRGKPAGTHGEFPPAKLD